MKAQRLFEMALVPMGRSPRSAGEMARHLEAFERTVRRDVGAATLQGPGGPLPPTHLL